MKDLQLEDQLNSIVREYSKIDKGAFINASTFYQHSDNPAVIFGIEKIRNNLLKLKKELETLRDTDFAGVISFSDQVDTGEASVSPEIIEFSCPHCDQYIETEREWVGMQASCPGCGKVIAIRDTEIIEPPEESPKEQTEKKGYESTEKWDEKFSNIVGFFSSVQAIITICILTILVEYFTGWYSHSLVGRGMGFAYAMIGSAFYFIVVGIVIAIYQMTAKISVKCTNCSTKRLLSFEQNNGIQCEVCGTPLFFTYSSFFVLNMLKLFFFIIPFLLIAVFLGPTSIIVVTYGITKAFCYIILRPSVLLNSK